jgi:hypothetical protein
LRWGKDGHARGQYTRWASQTTNNLESQSMKSAIRVAGALLLAVGVSTFTAKAQTQEPSRYLYVNNIELKPGHADQFAKLASEVAASYRTAKSPSYTLGCWPITGNSNRVLFFSGFPAYGDLEKNYAEVMSKPAVAAVINKDFAAEGELSTSQHNSIYEYRKDLSLRANGDLEKARLARIAVITVRQGQQEAFEHAVKEYVKGFEASVPEAHWAVYAKSYGVGSETTYLYISAMPTIAEFDSFDAASKAFREKVGADVGAMLNTQMSAAIESAEWDVVYFGNNISYVPDQWLADSPDFWGKK